jgi:hypothetical protein
MPWQIAAGVPLGRHAVRFNSGVDRRLSGKE